jgi:hypothetical protein
MSEARDLVSKISRGTGLLIFGKARSGRHRAGTYAARQDEEIAAPYQLWSHSSDNLFPAGIGVANVDRVLTPTVAFV